jgi:hypothetical protein
VGVGACGSDKKDGNSFNAGVDGNTMLGNLTPAQQITICQNQASYVHAQIDTTSLMRFVCSLTPAVVLAANEDACQAAMDSCVNGLSLKVNVNVPTTTDVQTICSTFPITQCSGTVSDYETCIDSVASVQLDIGTNYSCGKRVDGGAPLVGVSACNAVGPSCTVAGANIR